VLHSPKRTKIFYIERLFALNIGLTINAIVAADSVLIPVQAAYLPVKGLQQLTNLLFIALILIKRAGY